MSRRHSVRGRRAAWVLLAVFVMAGCASLKPGFEEPSVKVTAFRPLPSEGLAPRFEIGLRVVNPNPDPLKLRGMSYRVFLDDYEIVEGVANELPEVPAYGEADLKVLANVSLFDGIRLVNDLLSKPRDQVSYRLQAKLDIGAMLPAIRVEEKGQLGAPQ
jgi:LEA14-like dessication related protein